MALDSAADGGPDDKEKNCMVETLSSRTEYRIYCRSNTGVLGWGKLFLRHNNVANREGCCFRESCTSPAEARMKCYGSVSKLLFIR